MEIKKKFFTKLIFFILFITNSSFIIGLPNIEINEEVPKKYDEKLQYKFDPNIKVSSEFKKRYPKPKFPTYL